MLVGGVVASGTLVGGVVAIGALVAGWVAEIFGVLVAALQAVSEVTTNTMSMPSNRPIEREE